MAWLGQLPALDLIGRQDQVIAAFAGLRQPRPEFDRDRVAAILFLEAALAADQRRLVRGYCEHLRGWAASSTSVRNGAG